MKAATTIALLACAWLLAVPLHAERENDQAWIFTTFRGNGERGLQYAYSYDGLNWTAIEGHTLKPEVGDGKLLRDPSLVQGPDGVFHLVWTTAWRGDQGFGHASSRDLIHWGPQQFVPVMQHEPTTVNVWAPELFYDDEKDRYIICWASTIPGRFPDRLEESTNNHRMYYTTTKDFKTFSPTRLFLDPDFSVIDCVIVERDEDYVLVLKDNTRPERNLRVAFGESPLGPWRDISAPFTAKLTEGPTVVYVEDRWIIYYDAYGTETYGAASTQDFKTFRDVSHDISLPEGHKHGTAVRIPVETLKNLLAARVEAVQPAEETCERWGRFEVSLRGPDEGNPFEEGNPFTDIDLSAIFRRGEHQVEVNGFYDGEGTYRIRFSPPSVGTWSYETRSNMASLDRRQGTFQAIAPSPGNHGPVRTAHTFHFAYADGMPFKPIGTTCYAWTSQPADLQARTLSTLADAPFNKVRMCVLPKRYRWNEHEPPQYPFERAADGTWDFSRFCPAYFRNLEHRIEQLGELNIEADVILLHPYDKGHWGFDRMQDEQDDRYLQYVVSRLASFRNVWWSMANEYDFMKHKEESDWDRMIRVVGEADPYDRLLSIHNGFQLYNHNNPRLSHASIQNGSAAEDAGRAVLYRDVYRKPIVLDEVKYEGDIPRRWGNLPPEEMVHRFWEGTIAGCYVTHGECYLSDDDILWWSKGGVLKGESPARIAFLKEILRTAPAEGLDPIDKWQYSNFAGQPGEYYLIYLGRESPGDWEFFLPESGLEDGMEFRVEVIDAWNMTIEPLDEPLVVERSTAYLFSIRGDRKIELPDRPYIALRVTRTNL